jgi:pimeloyl-ACP methyl ester carboxylesterase
VAAGGVDPAEVHAWEHGHGPVTVLCLHETGATSEIWRSLARALESRARVIAYDRPGWGASPAPETYVRTTVGEQAATAASVLDARDAAPALLCGAGIGAVAALEVTVRRPGLALGAVLIEPPLLAFVPAGTEAMSEAAALVRDAVAEGGRRSVLDRYHEGGLGILSPGAERIPDAARDRGERAPASLFAEIAAVPSWELPVRELVDGHPPSVIIVGAETPPLLRDAAQGIAGVLGGSELVELGPGLPHHDQAPALADIIAHQPTANVPRPPS